jgi:CBS domain containing-hemolysin-like protein
MEDVIEELVGEIADEYDDDEDELTELEDGGYRVAARYSLMDLGELFEIELDDEDVDSVGGLMAKELGRLPMRGDVIVFSGLRFEADRIEGRRKRLVSVLVHRDQNLTDAQAAFGVDENEN